MPLNNPSCPKCKDIRITKSGFKIMSKPARRVQQYRCHKCGHIFYDKTIHAIVTVKLPYNPRHNPRNKITGECPLNNFKICSDITGSHHSYIEEGLNEEDIRNKAKLKYGHVTRIETI